MYVARSFLAIFLYFQRDILTIFKATRIIIGASIGIPAASLCINRRLYIIATLQTASITRAEVSRATKQ